MVRLPTMVAGTTSNGALSVIRKRDSGVELVKARKEREMLRVGDTFTVADGNHAHQSGAKITVEMVSAALAEARNRCPSCTRPFQRRNGALVRYFVTKSFAVCSAACVAVERELERMRRL